MNRLRGLAETRKLFKRERELGCANRCSEGTKLLLGNRCETPERALCGWLAGWLSKLQAAAGWQRRDKRTADYGTACCPCSMIDGMRRWLMSRSLLAANIVVVAVMTEADEGRHRRSNHDSRSDVESLVVAAIIAAVV